ncbi:ubiquitin-conjugating enzyme family protein [Artemisia annua]|uniref:Ubiquitin-conjugating enzyme family protein n=1 Tax=Artemisia annua TaxID=35608 RepID=A0A2U1KDA4_ARTAN|nr:ubiquitin-conjugating enzyme family protein [Artemisia annua]
MFMTDHVQEQEMEIEALEAILMDEFAEIHPSESGLPTANRCFQITLTPQDDEMDEASTTPVQLGLIFSHTEKYPDEIPLLNVRSIRGIHTSDLKVLKEKLEQEASENLGMAMIYTLVIVPHGEPVTIDTFLAWRDRYEAELALERAKLMPESALASTKEKKLNGRQWFETVIIWKNIEYETYKLGAAIWVGWVMNDEDDMLEHYLAEKDSSTHSSSVAN